jgi:hypothetical protein
MYMTVGRQHNERLNTPTNLKRRTETSGTHADILPGLRVIQCTYPLIEASRTIHHVASLDDRPRYARVQSFPNRKDVCMCSRCLFSSLLVCQSVQSLVMLSAYCHVHGPLGSRSLALWGVLRDRVDNQRSFLSTQGNT